LLQPLPKRPDAGLCVQIVRGGANEHADAPHALGLLRPSRKRPCRCRNAEHRDELAAFHCPMPPVLPTDRIAHPHEEETAALRDFNPAYDRSGSFASFQARSRHDRFTPMNGHIQW
jgi:hypothetical protein